TDRGDHPTAPTRRLCSTGRDLSRCTLAGGRRDQLTNASVAAQFGVATIVAQLYLSGMLQRTLPAGFIAPCLPTKTDKLPSGSQWLHKTSHAGSRIIARKNGGRGGLLQPSWKCPPPPLPADRRDVGTPALALLHHRR